MNYPDEEPLERSIPIVDAHQHFWSFADNIYLLDDFLADAATGHRIVATVFVQAFSGYREHGAIEFRPIGETENAVRLARDAQRQQCSIDVAAGIVGYADLRSGDGLMPVLEGHITAANGRFRGIRPITARDDFVVSPMYDPPPRNLMDEETFIRGAACLYRLGLSLDCYVFFHQLGEVERLARRLPDLPIVLNHAGMALGVGPHAGKREEVFERWRTGMRKLAGCRNVHVKLGGMGMGTWGFDLHEGSTPPSSAVLAATWRPFVDVCIDAFGTERCMFEGNFPMDRLSCRYGALWNGFQRLTTGFSGSERQALFHDTAARFYRLRA